MSRHKKINKTKKLTKKQTRGESIFSSDDDRSSRSSCRSRRSSFTSTSALSTPPRPFSRASKFDTTNKFPQIRVRKTRWEPLPEEIQRPKEVKKRTKSKKELIRDFHKEKDHFRPLLDFIDDRKQMAAELLDSIDVRTRNKIFPELKEKNIFECRMIVYHFLRGMTRKRIMAVMQGENLSDISSTTESEDIDNAISSPSCSIDSRANSIIKYRKENSKKSNGNRKNNQSKEKVRRKKKKKMEEELEEGEVRSSQEEERMKESSERSSSDYNEDDDGQHVKNAEEMKNVEPEPKQHTEERTQQKLQEEPNFVISLNFSMPFTRESAECSGDDREEKDDGEDKFGQQRVICILPPSPPLLVNGVDESAEESREGLTSTPSPSDILLVNNSDGEESRTEDKQRHPSLSTDENQAEDEEMEEGELGEEEEEEKGTGRSQSIISDEGEKTTIATIHSVVPADDRVSEEEIEEPDIELVDE